MICESHRARAAVAALALLAVGSAVGATEPSGRVVAIEHATILTMGDAGRIDDGTVVWRGDRILAVGAARSVRVPSHAKRIDGRGKFVMPALSDMHVHVENEMLARRMAAAGAKEPIAIDAQDVLLPYVANGVLQIFNLSAGPEAKAQRDAVAAGTVLGPHIALAVMVDGDPPINAGMARVAATPEAGRQLVTEIAAGGYDAVKTYTNLTFETFSAIVAEARARGLKVVGHIPLRQANRTGELLQPGFGVVAHLEEFAYQSPSVMQDDIPRFTDLAKRSGVWQITTLELNERVVQMTRESPELSARPELRYVHPLTRGLWQANNRYAQSVQLLPRREAVTRFNPVFLRALLQAGVPLMTGTDSLVAGVIPGFGLHDELEALAAAGMPAATILEATTRVPAEWLGVAQDRGSLAAGKRANLLLLDADPLADVANTRRLAAVVANGRTLTRAELDERMQALAGRYAALAPIIASIPAAATADSYGHDE